MEENNQQDYNQSVPQAQPVQPNYSAQPVPQAQPQMQQMPQMPQMPYGQNQMYAKKPVNGLAIAAMVIGIVGIFFFSIILGPLAIVLAAFALRNGNEKSGRGMAIAGLVLGIIDTVLAVILLILAQAAINSLKSTLVYGSFVVFTTLFA